MRKSKNSANFVATLSVFLVLFAALLNIYIYFATQAAQSKQIKNHAVYSVVEKILQTKSLVAKLINTDGQQACKKDFSQLSKEISESMKAIDDENSDTKMELYLAINALSKIEPSNTANGDCLERLGEVGSDLNYAAEALLKYYSANMHNNLEESIGLSDNIVIIVTSATLALLAVMVLARRHEKRLLRQIADQKESALQNSVKIANSSLRQEQQLLLQYKSVIDSISLVVKADTARTVTYANEKFYEYTNLSRDKVVGKNIREIFYVSEEERNAILATLDKDGCWHGRIDVAVWGWQKMTCALSIVLIRDAMGGLLEIVYIGRDITEEVKREELLRQKEYEHQQLMHEQEMAKELEKSKQSMLVLFTHELKTPLNAIINFSEYIASKINLQKNDTSELQRLSMLIHKNGQIMLDIVTTILDINKLKDGKLNFKFAKFSLSNLVKNGITEYAKLHELAHKDVSFNVESNEKFLIRSDELRMRQVFLNLYSNAIKYGGDRIVISLIRNQDSFELSVEDNGEGIANKEEVFGLFEQGEDFDMTRSKQGTGVGLYFVKLFCEKLGFGITLLDSPLGGAKFVLFGKLLGGSDDLEL